MPTPNPNINRRRRLQQNRRIAYKSTPVSQFHYPESLLRALKQNLIKFNSKKHSDRLVFVLVRLVGEQIEDMRVFDQLNDATTEALYAMVHEHPEAFAIPAQTTTEHGREVKSEPSESASSVIAQLNARPDFMQVPQAGRSSNSNSTAFASVADQYQDQNAETNASTAANIRDEADTLFVIKEEDAEQPRPHRIQAAVNSGRGRGRAAKRPRTVEAQQDGNDNEEDEEGEEGEPVFVYWGDWKISSFGLKLEAYRGDGTSVKVSVHLKNRREPADKNRPAAFFDQPSMDLGDIYN